MNIVQNTTNSTTFNTTNTIKKGCVVRAKVFGGGIVERLVWEQADNLVYLCTKRCFDMLINGDNSIRPIGFPEKDVILK